MDLESFIRHRLSCPLSIARIRRLNTSVHVSRCGAFAGHRTRHLRKDHYLQQEESVSEFVTPQVYEAETAAHGKKTNGKNASVCNATVYSLAVPPCVGFAAAVATLAGYTTGLLYGFTVRVYSTGSILGSFIRVIYSELLYSNSVYI
jgi:hypothetical protein